MKQLCNAILKDWEIVPNRPTRLCGVQLGDSATLMGLADRLIDEANAAGADVGLAVVQTAPDGYARHLKAQDGLYTCIVRGDLNEREVRTERVVQCVLEAAEPVEDEARVHALASSAELLLLERDAYGMGGLSERVSEALAARILEDRYRLGLKAPYVLVLSDDAGAAGALRAALLERDEPLSGFRRWLEGVRFCPSFIDGLVSRCTPGEAARLCEQKNYRDAMLHIAEPYANWVICADDTFRMAYPLDRCGQVRFADDIGPELLLKKRLFDAGLCAFAALGALHADGTLAECVRDEPLRELVGRAFTEELLPRLPVDRGTAGAYLIGCYERYSNPLNDHFVPDCVPGMIGRIREGLIPAIRAYAEEEYTAPPCLSAALAAAILLYADVREQDGAYYTVLGGDNVPIADAPEVLEAFATMSADMPAESLAYAVLADRTLWGEDLREVDGLEQALTNAFSARLADKAAME